MTSGEDSVPDTYAQCEVEFTSLSNQPVSIPNGTIVLTLIEPVVRFATTRDIIVAGGIDLTAVVPVIALQPGEIGNVAENQIVAMEGNIGVNLKVNNPQACEGGLELLTSVGIESDLEKLRMELKQQLIQTATEELLTQLGDGIEILNFRNT